ncbi:hypothetical protein ACFZB0_08985 [Streptomyces rubiginosohelvolus]|uniref:DUF7639 domain-containing protein n=1 Tax=Streptomyces TaxID=1883 RepID=UPI00211D9120|nr:hypothetical protein [Streptomyces sp. gb14]
MNERPDSTGRAPAAVDVLLGNRTEDNRAAAEAAFLAVPASRHHYALGDMESAFRGDKAGLGRNWTGRLLGLVRSEPHLRRNGIPGL